VLDGTGQFNRPASRPPGSRPGDCPYTGRETRGCEVIDDGVARIPFALEGCTFPTLDGVATVDGTVVITSVGLCPGVFFLSNVGIELDLTTTVTDLQGTWLYATTTDLRGRAPDIALSSFICTVPDVTLEVTGTVRFSNSASAVALTTSSATIRTSFAPVGGSCAPQTVRIVLDGAAVIHDESVEPVLELPVRFDGFAVEQAVAAGGPRLLTMSGAVEAACAGRRLYVETSEPIATALSSACASGGAVRVRRAGALALVRHGSGGSVTVAPEGGEERPSASCLAPSLRRCAP
jgi:hypothetical protein